MQKIHPKIKIKKIREKKDFFPRQARVRSHVRIIPGRKGRTKHQRAVVRLTGACGSKMAKPIAAITIQTSPIPIDPRKKMGIDVLASSLSRQTSCLNVR